MISRLTFASPLLLLVAGAPLSAQAQDAPARTLRLEQDLARAERRLDTAQLYDRPPADIDDEGFGPSPGREPSGLSVRLDKLESQMRSLNGRIEELQHDIGRIDELLRATRPDAPSASRPDVASHADRVGAAPAPVAPVVAAPPAPAAPPSAAPPGASLRRGDAFDPSRDPNAAGAPRPLGTTAPSAPLPSPPRGAATPAAADLRAPGAPLDLTHGRPGQDPLGPPPAGPVSSAPGPAAMLGATQPAPAATSAARGNEFDLAVASLENGQYEAAEKGFSAFLAKNPKSRLAPQATFELGESFFLRGRHREAAEKYLEISTKYPSSPQAPEAMLRLGQALHALGAKEQACASFGEISIKYPNASAQVKDAAQREAKKNQC